MRISEDESFCLNHYLIKNVSFSPSLPARGVWIEINHDHSEAVRYEVAPRKGSVD